MGLPYSSEEFDYDKRDEGILHQIDSKYQAIDGCVAICVQQSGVWDLTSQEEIVQLDDGSFLAQSWHKNGSKSELSERRHINLDIDLRSEFAHLKSAPFKLRSMLNKNPNLATREEYARVAYLYLVVGNETEWLGFPRHIEGIYEDNALNRICDAMARAFSEGGEGYFSLMDEEDAKRIIDTIKEWPMFVRRQGYELIKRFYGQEPRSIQAYATETLAQDAKINGFEIKEFQPLEILGGDYKKGSSGLVDFVIKYAPNEKPIRVSPVYVQIDENEQFADEIKAYQESLAGLKWIAALK